MIQLLNKNTIDKIAAGEVVERPMAIVKELVENAIDANATAITVEIKDGGTSFIRITDNGCGIFKEQITTAFMRHATSKITSIEDLLTVHSLGFRGEALSSIAAVSQVELITKTHEQICGVHYEINGGIEKTFEEIGCPDGTTFICRNIFYNTPARRKFLKSNKTESGYINDLMERFALSHADIRFTVIMDGKTKLQTSGNGQAANNIYYIYGSDVSKALIPVDFHTTGINITGFIGKPEISRGNRTYMNYFINGRYVKSAVIAKAIEDAFGPYLMSHRYPFTVLFIQMDSKEIDVNVHPTKMEVRFSNQDDVYHYIYETVCGAIKDSMTIPKVPLVENTKTSSAHINQTLKEKIEPFETALEKKVLTSDIPAPSVVQETPVIQNVVREHSKSLYEQQDISLNELVEKEEKVDFKIIGQVFATYWLIQYKEELLIIDQHAAHEKVLYEKLLKSLHSNQIMTQDLLVPLIVTLSVREEEVLTENMLSFEKIGFVIEHFGGKEYAVKAVPYGLLDASDKELFLSLLDELMENGKVNNELLLSKCASMACKAAIKGNHTISFREAQELIGQMLLLDNPYNCPHGRPTTISISKQEFEKKFKRIV